MTDHIHKAAWAARQADPLMRDGLVETAGLPGDGEFTEDELEGDDLDASIVDDLGGTPDPEAPVESEGGSGGVLSEGELADVLSLNVDKVNAIIEANPDLADQIIAAERASEHPRKGIVGDE